MNCYTVVIKNVNCYNYKLAYKSEMNQLPELSKLLYFCNKNCYTVLILNITK